ncbi:hypothetical protein PF010_g30752, partial [Phytophthora fragariae]
NVKNSEPIVGQPAHSPDISRYLVVSANWGFNFETSIYREMKDEDGELYTAMLFAAKGDPNCYPMWASRSVSGGWLRPSVIEDTDFTAGQPQGWGGMLSVPCKVGISIVRDIYDVNSHHVGKGDWIVSCADGSAKQCKTSKTLSVKPLSDLQLLRNDNAHEQVVSVSVKDSSQMLNSTGASFELIAEVPGFFERGTKVGFEVCRSSIGDEVTTILYDDAEKRVIIDCSKSSAATCAVFADNDVKPISEPIWGYFYLLRASLHSRTC